MYLLFIYIPVSERQMQELIPSNIQVLGIETGLPSGLRASTLPANTSLFCIYVFSCFKTIFLYIHVLLFKKDLLTFIVHLRVCVSMYECAICVPGSHAGQRRFQRQFVSVDLSLCAQYPWRPKQCIRSPITGVAVNINHHVCDGNQNWTLGKNSVCC